MMSDAMNKTAPRFEETEKLWKKEEVRKAFFSLDLFENTMPKKMM